MKFLLHVFILTFSCISCSTKHQSIDGVAEMALKKAEQDDLAGMKNAISEELLKVDKIEKPDFLLKLFANDFSKIEKKEFRKHLNNEYDEGPLYRYRYTTEKGVELQVEFIFEDSKDFFKIKKFTLIPIDSFAKERQMSIVPYAIKVE